MLISEHDARLHQISLPVTDVFQHTQLIQDLKTVVYETQAVGISAVQIGVLLRVFLMREHEHIYVCFNPRILSADTMCQDKEGCLSFPGVFMQVERSTRIQVEYTDEHNQTVKREFTGLMARCFQHELDHLNGQTFDQRVSRLRWQLAKKHRR